MPENRTPEELVELAMEIRRRVTEKVQNAILARTGAEVRTETKDRTARDTSRDISRSAAEENAEAARQAEKDARDDDYWDLGKPKPRIYAKPEFRSHSVGVTDISAPDPEPAQGEAGSEKIVKDPLRQRSFTSFDALDRTAGPARSAPAGQGGSAGRVVMTAEGYRSVPTGSYRRHTPPRTVPGQNPPQHARKQSPGSTVVRTETPEGMLIRKITVRTWETDTEFYNRFLSDALRSHNTPWTGSLEARDPVPYTSFVPQYAHMNASQLEYYRYVRENIRRGTPVPCDYPYVLIYIYEILNLPGPIPPEEGIGLLARIWTGYRKKFPRLDGALCEWVPDYCMIHGVALPEELLPLLPEIVPKAQFKEFYLDRAAASASDGMTLSKTVIENSSDYNYRNSRYYAANRDAYESLIPAAVTRVLALEKEAGEGIFSLDRTYQMTRDSYVGAVAASSVKRRIDLDFVSFTRRADTRLLVTAMVKYAENRLRAVLGIKAKLGAEGVPEKEASAIDAYFAPMMPTREQIQQKKEDAYMPPDYLKNYEAETTGFDPDEAAAIEAQSWANTSRLTGGDYGSGDTAGTADMSYADTETPAAEGEITDILPPAWDAWNGTEPEEAPGEDGGETIPAPEDMPAVPGTENENAPENAGGEEVLLKNALRAAMDGRFRAFCRENGLYEGDAADRINAVFLDLIGDVALEVSPDGGFRFIEEYREDAEEWLK
jgi:hypothetical protein